MASLRLEVRVRYGKDLYVTRHYVLMGAERALCGELTERAPTHDERWARLCRRCDRHADALYRKGS